jgi:hypothetical protein
MDFRKLTLAMGVGMALTAAHSPAMAGAVDSNGLVTQFDGGLTVGAPTANAGNCYPFSCFASETHPGPGNLYQQVYGASSFGSSPGVVFSVSFFNANLPFGDGNMDSASYDVSFWTTALGPDGLTTSAAANRGTLLSDWGSYSLGGAMPQTLTLNGTPFLYDPAQGNLLMQVQVTGLTFPESYQSFFEVDASGLTTSRYFDYNVTSVPEPAAWAMMLVGFGLVGLATRRRQIFAAG